ncbi:unnamed protein product, partial [Rotaria sp. Silwood2]
ILCDRLAKDNDEVVVDDEHVRCLSRSCSIYIERRFVLIKGLSQNGTTCSDLCN